MIDAEAIEAVCFYAERDGQAGARAASKLRLEFAPHMPHGTCPGVPEQHPESFDHRETFETFFRELWATMIDPLEEPPSFSEGMATILAAAIKQRQQLNAR